MADSLLGIDKRCIFRETFESEQSVRRNSGIPTGVIFNNGIINIVNSASYNRITYINENEVVSQLLKKPSTLRIRVKFASYLEAAIFDIRIGTIWLNIRTTTDNKFNVTGCDTLVGYRGYFISTSTYSLNVWYDLIVTSSTTINSLAFYVNSINQPTVGSAYGSNLQGFYLGGDPTYPRTNNLYCDLLEIYSGIFTADEVKNLYENKRHKDLILNHDEQLGPELCINGGFDTASNWVMGPNGSIANGVANLHSFENNYQSEGNFAGKLIKFTIKMVYDYPDSTTIWDNLNLLGTIPNTIGYHSIYVRPIETTAFPNIISQGNITIDDVSFKEVLVPTVREILNVSAVNGVIRNKYSGESYVELITNGGFDSDTWWTKEAGWTISGGTAIATSAAGGNFVYRGSLLTAGKTYRCTFTVVSITSGAFRFSDSGSATGITRSVAGTYTEDFTVITGTYFGISTVGTTTGVIDDVSVKEVIPSITSAAVPLVKENDVYAMKFNGSSSVINCGSYDSMVGNKTFIAWALYNDKINYYRIFCNGRAILYLGGRSNGVWYFMSDYSSVATSAARTVPRQFFHIAVTRTSTGLTTFYINGSQSGTANQSSGTPIAGTTAFNIGWDGVGGSIMNGLIPSVRVVDGILTAQEIAQLYSDEKDKYGL